jgi:hypothetical protein
MLRRSLLVLLILVLPPEIGWAQRFAPRPPSFRPPTPAPRFTPGPHVPLHSTSRGGAQDDDKNWIWWVVGGGFGLGGLCWAISAACRKQVIRIRIHSTPPGEAPEHVRSAWIGLELPLIPGETGPRPVEQVEVLSMQKIGATMGYLVDGKRAIELLAARSTEAAAWWKENCAAFLEANGCFVFPPEVCERV